MESLKRASKVLALISGIFLTIVTFISYWSIYSLTQSYSQISVVIPLVLLFIGLLGGILLIVSTFFIKSTKLMSAIMIAIGTTLGLAVTIFLIIVSASLTTVSKESTVNVASRFNNIVMYVLPFFVMSNALGIVSTIMIMNSAFAKPKEEDIK